MFKKIRCTGILQNAFGHLKKMNFPKNPVFLLLFLTGGFSAVFAQAGKDGALTVTAANTVLARYTKPTADIAAGTIKITVSLISDLDRDAVGYLPSGYTGHSSGFSSNTLTAGDLLMIYQAQGAAINTTNTISYGTVTALNGAGTYELARVAGVTGNEISLSCATKQAYAIAGHVQIIRVPQYTVLTVNSGASLTAVPWGAPSFGGADESAEERRRGGINVVSANNVVNNGNINANGAGFRGGTRDNLTSGPGLFFTDFVSSSAAISAEKGESVAGYRNDYDALGGRYGRGAAANGGGGGNAHNAGGGGGANGGVPANWFRGAGVMGNSGTCSTGAWTRDPDYIANGNALTTSSGGGRGGYTYGANDLDACANGPSYPAGFIGPGNPASDVVVAWGGDNRAAMGGLGGRPITSAAFQNRIVFGGGGGAGDGNNDASNDGGDGGGIVFVMVSTSVTGAGSIEANGENALPTIGGGNDAPGGGGGGGTVLIQSRAINNTQMISATGGAGGNQLISANESEGPGGGGGGGVIAVNAGTDTSVKTVMGGIFGTSTSPAVSEFPANGATGGNSGIILGITETVSVCGVCYKPATVTGTALDTKLGITALSRAGVENSGWPMVRKGAHVALEAKTKGFVPTRMANPATSVTNPVDGMMVYDTTQQCLKIYMVDTVTPANSGWKCFNSQACPD